MKQRNLTVDIAKAISILLMIIGHCWAIPYMPYRHFIFTFHMPLFFILSGYFYKIKDRKACFISDVKHLMMPYIVTCFVLIFIFLIKGLITGHFRAVLYYTAAMFIGSGSNHTCLFLSHLPNIGALWFFPALLVCKTTYNCMSTYNVHFKLLFATIISVVATLIGRYLIFIPMSVLSGLSAVVFYAIGNYYKEKSPKITWIHLIIGIICWYLSFKYSHIYLVKPQTDLYIIDIIGATTATFLVYQISQIIQKILKHIGFLLWIGRNSMYILCFHLIDLNVGISRYITMNIHPAFLVMSMISIPLLLTILFTYTKSLIFHNNS